jgi:glycosyltransferase involved in cell wall biosynthesis
MKICFVAFDLNPTLGSECGNADIWLKVVAKNFKVVAFTLSKHKKDILNESYENVDFIFIDLQNWLLKILKIFTKNGFYPLSNFLFTQKVKKILKTHNDIKLIHCITPAGIHSFNTLHQLGIPLIAGPVGGSLNLPQGLKKKKYYCSSGPRNFYYHAIKYLPAWRNYFNNAKIVLIGTKYLKEKLPFECRRHTEEFFDTVVNPDVFLPSIKKTNDVTICYIGRVEYYKGIDLLLESFEVILKMYSNVNLVIAGGGSYAKKIPVKNPKILYLGRIPRSKVLTILNQSDIYCLPTLREPGGASILEAMSCGLPVITTNYGGPEVSVTNECGFKIDPLDRKYYIEQLTLSLKKLIDDPELRKRMGVAGRRRIQQEFSPKALEEKIIELYQRAMAT